MGREYADVDVPMNIRERGHTSTYTQGVLSLRDSGNRILREYIEQRRAQGWQTEGPTEMMALFYDHRLNYKTHWLTGRMTLKSARLTFYKDTP